MSRSRRRTLEATAYAAVLGGLPSTLYAVAKDRRWSRGLEYGVDVTTRIGVLLPPFRPGLARGVGAHLLVSAIAGQSMAYLLPRRRSVAWGAALGLAMGVDNVVVIGRRISGLADLPVGPQLADNIAFGVVFAALVDRGSSN